jgi:hypothetical protein
MNRYARHALMTAALALSITSLAQAQATRTWVSGVGDDANPCSRTAPCKTFAGAISKTAAGGEISVLDPGGFGAVTITKAITINGDGTLAGILASLTNGVIVNAGPNDLVVLRNLSINGANNGLNGIRFLAGGMLVVQDVTISNFTQNGIDVFLNGSRSVNIRNVTVTGAAIGIRVTTTAGTPKTSITNTTVRGTGIGIDIFAGVADISRSIISQNTSFGVVADALGVVSIESSQLTGNGVAGQANGGSATLRLSNNDIYDNTTALGCGGGLIMSVPNNRTAGSGAGCGPTMAIPVQ